MAERRGARTIRDDDDYDDELADDGLADSADDEFAGRDAGLTAAQAARAALRQIAERRPRRLVTACEIARDQGRQLGPFGINGSCGFVAANSLAVLAEDGDHLPDAADLSVALPAIRLSARPVSSIRQDCP